MTQRAKVVVYIAIDCDGDFAVGTCEDTARERYADEIGDANERAVSVREVCLSVPCPVGVIEHRGDAFQVADEPEADPVTT